MMSMFNPTTMTFLNIEARSICGLETSILGSSVVRSFERVSVSCLSEPSPVFWNIFRQVRTTVSMLTSLDPESSDHIRAKFSASGSFKALPFTERNFLRAGMVPDGTSANPTVYPRLRSSSCCKGAFLAASSVARLWSLSSEDTVFNTSSAAANSQTYPPPFALNLLLPQSQISPLLPRFWQAFQWEALRRELWAPVPVREPSGVARSPHTWWPLRSFRSRTTHKRLAAKRHGYLVNPDAAMDRNSASGPSEATEALSWPSNPSFFCAIFCLYWSNFALLTASSCDPLVAIL